MIPMIILQIDNELEVDEVDHETSQSSLISLEF